jgi:hypothetical protein
MTSTKSNLIAMVVVTGSLSAVGVSAATPADAETSSSSPAYREAVVVIERALQSGEAEAGAVALRQAADQVARLAASNQLVQQLLADARTASEPAADEADSAGPLRAALEQAADVLRFRPVDEAPLPAGFPTPTPVGEIRVQQYPEYRLARTPIEQGQDQAFWTLFQHIQKNQIAMTAPVEMTYELGRANGPRSTDMAFLYRSVGQGQLGAVDGVEVADVPAQTAVSIGWRGDIDPENVERARKLLAVWLEQHAEEYEPNGELRVMGYNSPMVPADQRFFEVHIPVRPLP